MAELSARIDDPSLGITEDSVLVLRNAGPVGAGMPEWGMLPLPKGLLEQGVRDLVRISDARMSGTSYGTCVLHVAPEAAVGGPLALLRTGDAIKLDVEARTLDLLVDDQELAARRAAWEPIPPRLRPRLRTALRRARRTGGLRLRLRLSPRRTADAGARDLLRLLSRAQLADRAVPRLTRGYRDAHARE